MDLQGLQGAKAEILQIIVQMTAVFMTTAQARINVKQV